MRLIDADTPEKIRLQPEQAVQLGEAALRGIGYTEEESRIITHHLVDNSLCGYEFAGLPRILAIANSPELKKPRYPVKIIHETPVSAMLDGGNHVGYISVNAAAELAVKKVQASGIAVVGVANSWFSGRNAYYLEKIARAGYVGIHTVSGSPMVVPIGAKRPALGTNPIAFAFPGKENPFIFDMGTGATMWGEVLLHAFLGKDFDDEVGVDANGVPTRNAKSIVDGGVVPFAGHKGYGLSLAIQTLGLLAGARRRAGQVSDFGFLFIAFDPEIMMPADEFKTQLSELLQSIKDLPRQEGVDEIRIPSERSQRERSVRQQQGILLQRRVYDQLMEMRASDG